MRSCFFRMIKRMLFNLFTNQSFNMMFFCCWSWKLFCIFYKDGGKFPSSSPSSFLSFLFPPRASQVYEIWGDKLKYHPIFFPFRIFFGNFLPPRICASPKCTGARVDLDFSRKLCWKMLFLISDEVEGMLTSDVSRE